MITQKILESNPEGLPDIDLSDEVDSNNEDVEQLRETVRGIIILFVFYQLYQNTKNY